MNTIFGVENNLVLKSCFQHEKIICIYSSYRVMFFFIIWSEVGTSEQRTKKI